MPRRRRLLTTSGMILAALTSATVLGAMTTPTVAATPRTGFDLQAHRGGAGLTTESTPQAFAKALRLGVSTLELDTQISRDDKVIVSHDRRISGDKCRDTAPLFPDDPAFPYVGKLIKDLTFAQIGTLDCGYHRSPQFPDQQQIAGAKLIQLHDVFDLIKRTHAHRVKMNVETKVEAGTPTETAPRDHFVRRVHDEIARSGLRDQVTIQSFDWGALRVMHRLDPRLPLVALTNRDFLQVGQPGKSPWLGGLDADDFGGDLVTAAAAIPGVTAISPVQGFPQEGKLGDPDFTLYPDAQMVASAHARHLEVIPWTVDDPATMRRLIRLGVDGLITNRPDWLRRVMAEEGLQLPAPVRA
ncbi:glycerophosphodiester phosphodiesterase family protein [Williamsia sterculiae]|uniref:Glycerophosphoryl diester phosphodiesterase n=1 Tax=Williamsia sterculiae TaxID=1344003 RepID=A0A1N7CHI9_9NOCA|nr:glycerophosphodiester phosphodiesterase family protein [Williamsia sterculiae]SIR62983.1 glycerophosphoryl diester phosphodiesterase [Williamsia sterculiae]